MCLNGKIGKRTALPHSPVVLTGVFIVTDFFAAGLNADKETQWGIHAVNAAKEVQASWLIYSLGCELSCALMYPPMLPWSYVLSIGMVRALPEEC